MATIPAAGYISTASRTKGDLKTSLESVIASLRQIPGAAQVELAQTIASGRITPNGTSGVLVIDTEASTATDDLTNIVATNYPEGSVILIRNANAARSVVVKHGFGGTGMFHLDRNADYTLDDMQKWLMLGCRTGEWYEMLRGPIRMTSATVSKSATFTINKEDLGKSFLCTGTFTVNLLAASGAGSGFLISIHNIGTGLVTVDANASELIDGAMTLSVLSGWTSQLVCTGSAWATVASTGPSITQNPIINGTMEVWQRGTSLPLSLVGVSTGTVTLTADRWAVLANGMDQAVVTINRSTNVPTIAQAGVLLNYSLEVDVTTAETGIASTEYVALQHSIEGTLWRQFAQRQFTLSFWVMSPKTGTHGLSFTNVGADRGYTTTYIVNTANTWEFKTVTVSPSPNTGTWNYTNLAGLSIRWALSAGATFETSSVNSWQTITSPGTLCGAGGVECLDSTSNFFRLAGVKMELGSIATPLDVVSFDREYLRCLRFYQKSFNYGTAPVQNAGANTGEYIFTNPVGASTLFNSITIPLVVPMAANPTITLYNPVAANGQVRNQNTSTDCAGSSGYNAQGRSFALQATTPASSTTGHTLSVHWAASVGL